MNKTKRSLIISSAVMLIALVVAIVGVSAAWFGGSQRAIREKPFVVLSDTLQDAASIDINSAKGMSGTNIYPAIAVPGYLKGGNVDALAATTTSIMGDKLKNDLAGCWEAAECATVYFPIQVIGTPDKDHETEGRKSLDLKLQSATIGKMVVTSNSGTWYYDRIIKATPVSGEQLDSFAGTWRSIGAAANASRITFSGRKGENRKLYFGDDDTAQQAYTIGANGTATFTVGGVEYTAELADYKEEFNVELSLVVLGTNGEGELVVDSETGDPNELSTVATAAKYTTALTGDAVFYEHYGYDLYMLVQPGVTYYVKAVFYFNKLDEECNFDLLDTVVRFNFKLNIIADGSVIRNGSYKPVSA